MSLYFQPMPLQRRSLPFDDPDWVFELKYDGYRSLAIVEHDRAQLISRNGNPFASFSALAESISDSLPNGRAVIDGEICSLDKRGRPQFKNLMFHRGNPPCFFAFDLLTCDGKDLRTERLMDRKQELRQLLARACAPLKYTEYIDGCGTALFQRVCELDLEGVVAKHKFGNYVTDRDHSTWYKILNREYSQMQGREELFDRERHQEPVAGWHLCDLAVASRKHHVGRAEHNGKTRRVRNNRLLLCHTLSSQRCRDATPPEANCPVVAKRRDQHGQPRRTSTHRRFRKTYSLMQFRNSEDKP